MEADCPFCEIVAGEDAAHELYRTDDAMAFLDANPAVEGHTLVVPTNHCEELATAEDPTRRAVFGAVARISDALDRALDPDGFSVFHTSGPLVGSVTHAHVHVVPREVDDAISLSLDRRDLEPAQGEAVAERIRETI